MRKRTRRVDADEDLDKRYGIDKRYPRGDYRRHGGMVESDHEDDDAVPDYD